jgi:hypothetical protein
MRAGFDKMLGSAVEGWLVAEAVLRSIILKQWARFEQRFACVIFHRLIGLFFRRIQLRVRSSNVSTS